MKVNALGTGMLDARYMARALMLARRGCFTVHPNPAVGCVLVRNHAIVGEGWHMRAGDDHAEIIALHMAGKRSHGATMYVTLEPCSHHGRTPPCCEALVAAGVSRVVIAMPDPNPQVAGRGLDYLHQAGIQVDTVAAFSEQAMELNRGFVQRMISGLPWVRIKWASSLDGRCAMADGQSQWITGSLARRDAHQWRARSGAVISSVETVLADDCSLNVRLPGFLPGPLGTMEPWSQPVRVVLDRQLRTDQNAQLFNVDTPLIFFCGESAMKRAPVLEKVGARVIAVPSGDSGLDLHAVLTHLARLEINEVLVEAGPKLSGNLVQSGLAHEALIYQAPLLMGHEAIPMVKLPGLQALTSAISLEWIDTALIGKDMRSRALFPSGTVAQYEALSRLTHLRENH